MNQWKKRLSALLAAVMLVSLLPVTSLAETTAQLQSGGIGTWSELPKEEATGEYDDLVAPTSLLPLPEYSATLDMTGLLPDELEKVPVRTVIDKLEFPTNDAYEISADVKIAWAKGSRYSGRMDAYTIVENQATETMDLTHPSSISSGVYDLELIVGTAIATDPNNVRIRVSTRITPEREIFHFLAADTNHNQIFGYDKYGYKDYPYYDSESIIEERNIYQFPIESTSWETGQEAYLSFQFSSDFASRTDLSVSVYKGYFTTADAIGAAEAITDQVWKADVASGGYRDDYSYQTRYEGMPEFTVVVRDSASGSVIAVRPFIVYMYESLRTPSLSYSYNIYTDNENGRRISVSEGWGNSDDYDEVNRVTIHSIMLKDGYPTNQEYSYSMRAYDKNGQLDPTVVKYAVAGGRYTLEQVEQIVQNDASRNIKDQLFSDAGNPGGGYKADFSGGVIFTIVLTDDSSKENFLWYRCIKTVAYEDPVYVNDDEDTYFRVWGAGKQGDYGYESYAYWVMPEDVDGYFFGYADSDENFGFQTVLLMNYNGEPVSENEIYPDFYVLDEDSVKVYAGHNGSSGALQTSRTSKVPFTSGEAIQYSAVAGDGKHVKNYWVTFITPQEKAKLFINAANVADLYDKTENIPVREVYLDESHNYHHDIFIANVGKEPLTGIKVELDAEAQETLQVDSYWTADNASLGGFTSTERRDVNNQYVNYGELPNVSKIRLVPKEGIDGGVVKGHITITTENGGSQKIKLTGFAGDFKLTTKTLNDGVKYVPYSTLIQHNAMGVTDAVTFTVEDLPDWLTLKENGELYGIPTSAGEFPVEVTATYSRKGTVMSDSRSYILTVADNTDSNVWNYDSIIASLEGYENRDYAKITTAIPNQDGSRTNIPADASAGIGDNNWYNTWQLLETEGLYTDFLEHVYIDGRELTRGTDYTDAEGSTRITIRTQTMRDAGVGTHTIAAEFRPGKDNDATPLRRAAQNYTLTTLNSQSTSSPNSSASNSSSSGSSSGSSSDNVSTPSTSGGSTTVQVGVHSSTSGATAKAEIKTSDFNTAIESAVNEAAKRGTAPVVEIVIRTSSKAAGLEVKLPVSSLSKLADVENASLVITSDVAEIDLDSTALRTLVNQATGSSISLQVVPVAASALTAVQREVVGSFPVVDLSLLSTRYAIHDFGNGTIAVTLPYTLAEGQGANDVVVYYLEDNGSLTPCNTRYADGKVTFTTNHLSKYVIGNLDLANRATVSFYDVSPNAYYADAVSWAVENGITAGTGNGAFSPDAICTRAQIVSFLWRSAGSPRATGTNPFTDIDSGAYYYDAVLWAVDNGITIGTTETTFAPDATCTRAQAMAFVYRFKGSPAAIGTASFTDIPANAYYMDAVQWAVSNNVTFGVTPTAFGPDQDCTRAQIISFLYRAR